MTREHKLALIVGFALVLIVGVLISDHFSKARSARVGGDVTEGTPSRFGSSALGLDAPGGNLSPAASGSRLALGPTAGTSAPHGQLPDPEGRRLEPASPSNTNTPNEYVMGNPVGIGGPAAAPTPAPPATLTMGPGSNDGVPAPLKDQFVQARDPMALGSNPPIAGPESSVPIGPRPLVEQAITRDPNAAPPPPAAPPTVDPSKPVSSGAVARHTVEEGESIYRITANMYGDGTLWAKLRAHNPGKIGANGEVREGVTLVLPPKDVLMGRAVLPDPSRKPNSPGPAVTPRGGGAGGTTQTASANTYTVQKGDVLSEVAKRLLGSAGRMREIVAMNQDVLEDPDTLQAGVMLKIPTR